MHSYELAINRDNRWTKNDHEQRRENEKYQRGHHLYRRLCCRFLGSLSALHAHIVGMDAQRLRYARTKSIGLDEHGNQGLNIINAGSGGQFPHGFDSRPTDSDLSIDEVKLAAKFRVRDPQFLRNAHEGLIESETSLDANDEKVQGIRQGFAKDVLAFPDAA